MHQVNVEGVNYDTHLTHALESLLERISPEILREHQLSSMSSGRSTLIHSADNMMMMDETGHLFEDYEPSFLDESPRNYPAINIPPRALNPNSFGAGMKSQEPIRHMPVSAHPPRFVPQSLPYSMYEAPRPTIRYPHGFTESKLSQQHPQYVFGDGPSTSDENNFSFHHQSR